ncbi:L,D-transpeptidase family protein [Gorillibacterium sp. sgz500922]|uniref:L,D-transpeptidase family protein n=1 Tax=Gorillibacterium sp. sgz500922 TaxID=3446694 RepID=UPI003F66D89A
MRWGIVILVLSFCLQAPAYAVPAKPRADTDRTAATLQINPLKNELWVMDSAGNRLKKYPISLGKPRTPTPTGDYVVVNKHKNWGSGFGTRWIGLNVPWGTYGIHGTNRPDSIGHDASHGCVRMLNRHVEELYEYVEVGMKVSILGHVLGEPHRDPRRLAMGDIGGEVLLLQNRLRAGNYYGGVCNGRFNALTEYAMKKYEREHDLPIDGVVSMHDYVSLGLLE